MAVRGSSFLILATNTRVEEQRYLDVMQYLRKQNDEVLSILYHTTLRNKNRIKMTGAAFKAAKPFLHDKDIKPILNAVLEPQGNIVKLVTGLNPDDEARLNPLRVKQR